MNPLVFRKEDASSCLVPDKTWADIIGKPELFEQMAERVLEMASEAEKVPLLAKGTPLRIVKEVINDVIIHPLTDDSLQPGTVSPKQGNGTVLADAFWDEIGESEAFAEKLKAAIEKAYVMKQRIAENAPLNDASSLQDVKNLVNTAVLNPLQGADKGE